MARILLIDDANFMRTLLRTILEKAEHEIVGEGETGLDAVKLYAATKPDLTIMDITMPEMSGVEAMKEIRRYFPEAKIIMCSAMGQQKMVLEAIEAGAKDFIVKPFNEIGVLETIKRFL